MALMTNINLRNMLIYEIYVRNHGKTGKFKDIAEDIERIKSLGTDIIWFMPIYPIGQKNRKGNLGSPYAIRDYREVNPEYGTPDEFKDLVELIHKKDMKVMIDIVFNHTSPDSYLLEKHPEYFYRKSDGQVGNKVGEWWDVIDLDYKNRDLWQEHIDVLKYWARFGVDGFRCDVAPLIPLEFWILARQEVSRVKEGVIWLSETVHPGFILTLRNQGFTALSDSEIYNAFDITYDYDVQSFFMDYINGNIKLENYLDKIRQQEYIYPNNYVKLRFLENHDNPRAKKLFCDLSALKMWTAFMYFQKGAVLIYGGQEAQDANLPSLFEIDRVNWSGYDECFINYLKVLGALKKRDIFAKGRYTLHDTGAKGYIFITYENEKSLLAGIFNVEGRIGMAKVGLTDGSYKNITGDGFIEIVNGETMLRDEAVIFEIDRTHGEV